MARLKDKRIPRTPEAEAKRLDSSLATIRENYINEPTVIYKVGERVIWGAHRGAWVLDTADGGKFIKLRVESTDNNYGNPIEYEHVEWVEWYRLMPYRKYDNVKVISDRADHLYYLQTGVESVVNQFYSQGVELDPPYQRGIVWKDEQRQALLDSIFMNADIGKFVFAKRKWKDGEKGLEIIDGKQRFITLLDYMENRWAWRGKYFYDLHPHDQSHIEMYPAPQCVLEEPSMERILKIFLRVNVSGVPMETEHIWRVGKMLADLEAKHQ